MKIVLKPGLEMLTGRSLPNLSLSPASPCFVTPPQHSEEAAATRRRVLLHSDGDHFTLINLYNAFRQRECRTGEGGRVNTNNMQDKIQANTLRWYRTCWLRRNSNEKKINIKYSQPSAIDTDLIIFEYRTTFCSKINKLTENSH